MLVCPLVVQVDLCRSILLVSPGPSCRYMLGSLQSNAIKVPLSEAPQPTLNSYQRRCSDDCLRPETARDNPDGYATIVICVRRSSGLNAGLKLDS